MDAKRRRTRSPVALARMAMRVARDAMPAYSSKYSPKSYTQHQLLAILVLRQFFQTDYRGIIELLNDWSDLRRVLQLKKLPHYSTLCYAEQRLLKKGLSTESWMPFSVLPEPPAWSKTSRRPVSTPPEWRATTSAGTSSVAVAG